MPITQFENKVAFVTGAASGIGFAISKALAQRGVKVMMCDIERGALDDAIARLRATNADVAGIIADVSVKAQLEGAAEELAKTYGRLDILVNNAGIAGGSSYGEWTDESWNWALGVNLMSVIWGTEIFGPMIEAHGDGGQIINTASVAGLVASTTPSYSATKYAVVAISENTRITLKRRNIGVSVLCPGFIKSRIMESERNAPGGIETPSEKSDAAAFGALAHHSISTNGISADYVGELVCEAIEGDWPYIMTDTAFEPLIDQRFADIKAGFDRIRDRVPPRD